MEESINFIISFDKEGKPNIKVVKPCWDREY